MPPVATLQPVKISTLVIVGVGLIGGSIGLAAKQRGIAARVLGVGRRQDTLERACDRGAIDEGFLDLASAVRRAEVSIFCTPVDGMIEQILQAASHSAPGAILSDAGSTKTTIVRAVETRMPPDVAFVGGHPLAGSEKRGPEHADAELFQGRVVVLTRTPHTSVTALERINAFWRALGARVLVMDPEEHDQALALTSHLPHLLASALAGILPERLHELTASGFRDCTRIASGDPELWTGIFRQNREATLEALHLLVARLQLFRSALETGESLALTALLTQAKEVRDALDAPLREDS